MFLLVKLGHMLTRQQVSDIQDLNVNPSPGPESTQKNHEENHQHDKSASQGKYTLPAPEMEKPDDSKFAHGSELVAEGISDQAQRSAKRRAKKQARKEARAQRNNDEAQKPKVHQIRIAEKVIGHDQRDTLLCGTSTQPNSANPPTNQSPRTTLGKAVAEDEKAEKKRKAQDEKEPQSHRNDPAGQTAGHGQQNAPPKQASTGPNHPNPNSSQLLHSAEVKATEATAQKKNAKQKKKKKKKKNRNNRRPELGQGQQTGLASKDLPAASSDACPTKQQPRRSEMTRAERRVAKSKERKARREKEKEMQTISSPQLPSPIPHQPKPENNNKEKKSFRSRTESESRRDSGVFAPPNSPSRPLVTSKDQHRQDNKNKRGSSIQRRRKSKKPMSPPDTSRPSSAGSAC
jgi:hypothetical protein